MSRFVLHTCFASSVNRRISCKATSTSLTTFFSPLRRTSTDRFRLLKSSHRAVIPERFTLTQYPFYITNCGYLPYKYNTRFAYVQCAVYISVIGKRPCVTAHVSTWLKVVIFVDTKEGSSTPIYFHVSIFYRSYLFVQLVIMVGKIGNI